MSFKNTYLLLCFENVFFYVKRNSKSKMILEFQVPIHWIQSILSTSMQSHKHQVKRNQFLIKTFNNKKIIYIVYYTTIVF